MPERASSTNPTQSTAVGSDATTTSRPVVFDIAIVGTILLLGTIAMLLFHNARTGGEFSKLLYGDEAVYYLPAAEGIRDDGLTWFFTERSLWTGPLNPLWVAVFAGRVAIIKIANIALFVLAGFAVWDIARRLFGNRAGIIAVLFYATYLPFFKFTPTILSEPLFVPLVVFSLWFVTIQGRYEKQAMFVSGLLLGFGALARPTLQLFPLFLLVAWLLARAVATLRDRTRFRIDFAKIILIVVGFSIVVVPYAFKNAVSLDKLGIANGSGAVLYLGNDLRTQGYEPIDSGLRFNTIEITTPYTHLDTEGDVRLLQAAIDRIHRDPVDVALLQPVKALKLTVGSPGHYFRPQDNSIDFFKSRNWVVRLNLWDLVVTSLLVVIGIAGLIAVRTIPIVKLVFGSLVVYLILLNTLLFPIPRMMLAAFPVLMIFAGGAFVKLRRRTILGAVGLALAVVMYIAFEGLFGTTGTVSERYVGYFDPIATIPTDQWVASKDVLALPDGSVTSTGPDPYVVLDTGDFAATWNQMIFFTIRAPGASDHGSDDRVQIFWRTDAEEFSEERSQIFLLQSDEESHIYAVSPSLRGPWSGLVSEIRVDFPDYQPLREYVLGEVTVGK